MLSYKMSMAKMDLENKGFAFIPEELVRESHHWQTGEVTGRSTIIQIRLKAPGIDRLYNGIREAISGARMLARRIK